MIIRNGKPVDPDEEKKEEKKVQEPRKSSEPNYWGGDLFKKKK